MFPANFFSSITFYKRKIKLYVFFLIEFTNFLLIHSTNYTHTFQYLFLCSYFTYSFFINNVLISFIKQNNKYNHTLHANQLILGIT